MKTQHIETTAQMIFDATVLHLVSQGQRSTDGKCCQYRGPEGRRCAVGFHITDAEYSSEMEGFRAHYLHAKKLLPERLAPHIGLLVRLQLVHDCWTEDLPSLRRRMKEVAEEFGLSDRVLATLEAA